MTTSARCVFSGNIPSLRVIQYRAVNDSGRGTNTTGTRSSVTLYVHCLSCKFSCDLIQDKSLRLLPDIPPFLLLFVVYLSRPICLIAVQLASNSFAFKYIMLRRCASLLFQFFGT